MRIDRVGDNVLIRVDGDDISGTVELLDPRNVDFDAVLFA